MRFFHFFDQDFLELIWDRPLCHESTYLSSDSQGLSFRLSSSPSYVSLALSIFLKSSCHLISFDCRAPVPCRLDESEELFSSLGERWINSSGALRLIRFVINIQFFFKICSYSFDLCFICWRHVSISSFSNPIHSCDLRDSSPSFLVMSNILFVIFRRHVLILSCVFIMMSRVLWILWILSQVVLVFLSCCLKKNLQEWIVDFCYVFQKQKIFIFAVLFRCPGLFVFIVCENDDVNFLSKYEFSYYKISLKSTWQVWSLNFEFWFLNQAFLSYRNRIFLSSINLHGILSALSTSSDVLCRVVFMICFSAIIQYVTYHRISFYVSDTITEDLSIHWESDT